MPTQDELAGLYNKSKTYKINCGLFGSNVHLTELIRLTCGGNIWASEIRKRRASEKENSKAATVDFSAVAKFPMFVSNHLQFVDNHLGWNPWPLEHGFRVLPVRSAK